MRLPRVRKRSVLIAVAVLIALAAGWRTLSVHNALTRMTEPMGAVIGPADAPNTVVEFMDYRCAYCRTINAEMAEFVKRNPDVRLVIRHLPIYVAPSVKEASMALAAAKQGKFLAMHEYLASRENAVEDDEIPGIAKQLGLDPAKLAIDMKAGDVGHHMLDTLDGAKTLGIDRTPSFIFNGVVYVPNGGVPDIDGFEALYRQYKKK